MVYALEPLAYYFNIKPSEFWSSTYREINLYCEMQFVRVVEEFKQDIILQDATTDKLIQADSMSKRPKIVSLRKTFEELFKKK